MVECDYCGDSFEDEESYLAHLEAEHEGELSAIDARRVDGRNEESSSSNVGMIVLGVMIIGALAVVAYLAVVGLGGSDDGPEGQAHEHGTISIMIDGEPLNLAQEQYILADRNFHLDGPGDQINEEEFVWHTHAQGVTLEYALETFGMDVAADGSEVQFQGETYTSTQFEVNGESVEPGEYELSGTSTREARDGGGDSVRVVLNSTDA